MIRCDLKGRYKKEFQLKKGKLYHTDIAVVGDEVLFEVNVDKDTFIIDTPRIREIDPLGIRKEELCYYF